MLVKVCGMTSKKDIDGCANNKIDIIGFLLEMPKIKREDMLNLELAKELISYVPERMNSCLLIHYKDIEKVISIIEYLNPDILQIQKQSRLSIDDIKKIRIVFPNIKIIKTFYLDESTELLVLVNEIKEYIDSDLIEFVLLDSETGGSGKIHNWEISSRIVKEIFPFPLILAGGLSPENIQDAISKVKPFGVDVMSGVNMNNSKSKDSDKISLFVANIVN
ncbi:MAG: hypothetical protein AB7D49_09960 [Arcobacter sp.]|uniref:phosphoribosylanthranilate isomerase n=1 Tax=Arcobacter sp. TaxID=1872629 RepID=UPI003D13EFA0